MSFLSGLIGKVFGAGKLDQKRDTVVSNYSQAESLAVIFKLEDEEQYKIVRQYLKFVKDEHGLKRVMALAYVDDKEPASYLQSRIDFDFFSKKEVNWQQVPSGITVDNFCDEAYDIFIDLTSEPVIPLQHILTNSHAKFRVGRKTEKNDHLYDLMIDMGNKQGLKPFIEQINHYLTIINK